MRTTIGALGAATLSLALLGACSKPAENTADATAANATAAASDTAGGAMAAGGVVSPPPENGNDAVNPDGNQTDAGQAAGSNSFTEGQARGRIENAGYTNVTGLMKTPQGLWTGKATKDGKTTSVSVDFKGAVSAQ